MFLRLQKIDAEKLIKPMEIQLFWSPNPKKRSKTLKKHYLEKVLQTRFREGRKPYKTNRKLASRNARKDDAETL